LWVVVHRGTGAFRLIYFGVLLYSAGLYRGGGGCVNEGVVFLVEVVLVSDLEVGVVWS
jgi:hypothetical protein